MQQDAGSVDVAQEIVPQAGALGRALDQTGDVGEDGPLIVALDHAQDRCQRGEGIVGNLGIGVGDARQEGGLADVGKTDDPDLGDHPQLQAKPALFAGFAQFVFTWSAPLGGDEVRVAPPPSTAPGRRHMGTMEGQIGDAASLLVVEDQGADRNLDQQVLPHPTGLAASPPEGALLGLEVGPTLEVQQRVEVLVGLQHDVSSPTAVAAVGSALGDVQLTLEGHAAVAAISSFDEDPGLVDEVRAHGSLSGRGRSWSQAGSPSDGGQSGH